MLSNLGKRPLLKVGIFAHMSLTFTMTCLPTESHDPFCQNISLIIRVGLVGRMESGRKKDVEWKRGWKEEMMILYDICLARGINKWKHEKWISLSLVWQRQRTRGKKEDFVFCVLFAIITFLKNRIILTIKRMRHKIVKTHQPSSSFPFFLPNWED